MSKRGFTMVELMITISIIAILAGLLFAVAGTVTKRQKKEATKMLLSKVEAALHMYKNEQGSYPSYVSTSTNNLWASLGSSGGGYLTNNDLSTTKNLNGNNICDEYTEASGQAYGTPLIYLTGFTSVASKVGDIPSSSSQAYFGRKDEFELWSAGPDGDFSTGARTSSSSSNDNYDNITVGKYGPGM